MGKLKQTLGGDGGSKRRILYVEMAAGAGGSVTGLYRLLQGIDRDRFAPVVMLHRSQPLGYMFRDLGLEIVDLPGSAATGGESAVAGFGDPASKVEAPRVPATGRQPSGLYWSARFYLWFVRRCLPTAWAIRDVIRKERIDAVHLNDDIAFNRVALLGAALARVPCLAHVRFFYETRTIDWPLGRYISHYVYMSRALESYTLARFPAARGTVVYDGLTEDYFQPPADYAAVRRELGLEPADFVVGSLGRLIEWKGHKVLLRALSQLAGKAAGLKCLIVGEPDPPTDTRYLDELKVMVADLGLARVVQFTGFRADVRRILSAVDVLVHSSSEPEPFGLVIIEGMAAGKPVIATAAGGVLDIVDDGLTGILVPTNDSTAMAAALRQLVSVGSAGRQQLGQAARQAAMKRFTVDAYARGVERVYEQMFGGRLVLQREGC